MKRCARCGEEKPLDDFWRETARLDGRRSYCKSCSREYVRDYKRENPEKARDYNARCNRRVGRRAEQKRAWDRKNAERKRKERPMT